MMHEEKTKMRRTVFGEVLAELLEERDMPATLAYVEGLVEGVQVDAALLIQRIGDPWAEHPGDATMAALSERLKLSEQERAELAFAFAFEDRRAETTDNAGRIFGTVEITDEAASLPWRELPRSEMFNRVIGAVDGARLEAEAAGDERYVRYVEAVLFPFLEEEQARAQSFEWMREHEEE